MEYNTCCTCGAKDGRAGILIDGECQNCHNTRRSGAVVVHTNLARTSAELAKTFEIIPRSESEPNNMREMTNADFAILLEDCPSTDQEEIFNEAARRIQKLEAELQAWKAAADGGEGCDTPRV